MTDAQTEARAIVERCRADANNKFVEGTASITTAELDIIDTALAAKDAELATVKAEFEEFLNDRDAELSASFDAGHYRAMAEHATPQQLRADRAEAQLAEARKALLEIETRSEEMIWGEVNEIQDAMRDMEAIARRALNAGGGDER